MNPQTVIAEIKAFGLSQLDIEKDTGIKQPTLSRWVNGATPESIENMFKLIALRDRLAADHPAPVSEVGTNEQAAA